MKSYSDLLKGIKKDIEDNTYNGFSIEKNYYIHFVKSNNYFNGTEITSIFDYKGTLSFESDNKVYYHLDDSGDNMVEIPTEKDELFNFMVFTGLTQEDIDIFDKIIDLYFENH